MIGEGMFTLAAKVALVAVLGIGAMWADGGIDPIDTGGGECGFNCCVNQCIHDSSTGCNGGTRCCEGLCR
jgi:hypothetical protein